MFLSEPIRSADFPWAVKEFVIRLCFGAVLIESFDIIDRDSGADEDCPSSFGRMGGDIDHPMVAVGEIGVNVSGWAEHDLGSWGWAPVGMGAGIKRAGICFDFDELARAKRGFEDCTKKEGG